MSQVKMYIVTTTTLIFTIYLTIVAQETTTVKSNSLSMENLEYWAVTKFLHLKGKTPAEIQAELKSVYGDAAPSFTIVKTWVDSFVDDLHIITREEWGARAPKSPADNLSIKPAPYVIIHHSAGASCNTQAACQLKMKGIQNYHMDNKNWFDIGYNFVVGEDGNVYEGRGWGKKGAHSIPYNNKSIGICILGDYRSRTPNVAAVEAISKLIAYGVSNNEIKSDYKLLGHRQTWATNCPGDDLFAMIQSWPHWERKANK